MLKYGDHIDDRVTNTLRYTFSSVSNFLVDPTASTGKGILRCFLTSSADKNEKFAKFIVFYKSCESIVKFYKARFALKKKRIAFLAQIWDKNVKEITQNNMLGKGKTKKAAKLAKKIMALEEGTKEKVLGLYYEYCYARYRIRFIKYRMNSETGGGDDFSKENKIQEFESQFIEIDKVLFGHDLSTPRKKDDDKGTKKGRFTRDF